MKNVKRYLGFDTSSVTGIVVAFEVSDQPENPLRIVAEWSLSLETSRHSERLLWTIDTVLQSAGWTLKDLTAIAVGVGPGSFTGLRIGVTTAGMLAAQMKLRVIAVSSLALLARGAQKFLSDAMTATRTEANVALEQTLILACTDASKGEWFTLIGSQKSISQCVAASEEGSPGIWATEVTEKAVTPEEALQEAKLYLEKYPEASWLAVGQSIERYENEFKTLPAKRRIELNSTLHQVQPRVLAMLVNEAIQQGFSRDSSELRPRYLRDSDAQVKLRKGLLKPAATENHAPGSAFHRGGIA